MYFVANSSVLSSLRREGNTIIVRVCELNGVSDQITLIVPDAKSARLTNLDGVTIGTANVDICYVSFTARPHGITQVVITVKESDQSQVVD